MLDNLYCPDDAADLSDCTHNGWGSHNCDHREDVVLSCSNNNINGEFI